MEWRKKKEPNEHLGENPPDAQTPNHRARKQPDGDQEIDEAQIGKIEHIPDTLEELSQSMGERGADSGEQQRRRQRARTSQTHWGES